MPNFNDEKYDLYEPLKPHPTYQEKCSFCGQRLRNKNGDAIGIFFNNNTDFSDYIPLGQSAHLECYIKEVSSKIMEKEEKLTDSTHDQVAQQYEKLMRYSLLMMDKKEHLDLTPYSGMISPFQFGIIPDPKENMEKEELNPYQIGAKIQKFGEHLRSERHYLEEALETERKMENIDTEAILTLESRIDLLAELLETYVETFEEIWAYK